MRHFVFPIWILWRTAGSMKSYSSVSAEEDISVGDDYFPDYLYECENPCDDGSFCGRDLQCHSFSCENWYTLGHPIMTGYTPGKSPTTLDCATLEPGEDRSFLTQDQYCADGKLPTAVTFLDECQGNSVCASYRSSESSSASSPQVVAHMNRKCTAVPSDGFGFACYDVAPDTDLETYFADYVAATTDLEPIPCDAQDEGNAVKPHVYTDYVGSRRISSHMGSSSADFNVTLASKSIVARLFQVKLNYTIFPLCEDGCKDTEFCGQDGTCHEFNCVNVYDYGPKTVTGHEYQDTSSPNLECSSESPTFDDSNPCLSHLNTNPNVAEVNSTIESTWPLLIRYYCSKFEKSNSSLLDFSTDPAMCAHEYLDGRYATFNRHCFAQPNPYQNFSCYDMNPDTDLEQYLQDYLNRTTLDAECTADNLPFFHGSEPDEGVTVGYRARHSYMTCIEEIPLPGTASSSNTNCAFVFGSVNSDTSDLTPIDYERLRTVVKSNIIGNLPDDDDDDTGSSSSFATNYIVLGTTVIVVLVLMG